MPWALFLKWQSQNKFPTWNACGLYFARLAVFGVAITGFLAVLLVPANDTNARQFRNIRPLAKPEAIPQNATPVVRFRRVRPEVVKVAVLAIADAWNTGNLSPMLSREKFYDRDRLLDALKIVVPNDAKLRVISVGGVNTLQQYFEPRNGRKRQVNIVSAIVKTQLEFHDPNNGLIKLPGRNEFVLEIVQ